jgi:hypothetical protein
VNFLSVLRANHQPFKGLPLITGVLSALPWQATVSLTGRAHLESPLAGSFESGIGLIRGWVVCEANTVEMQLDGVHFGEWLMAQPQ